jgi:hypothetical protein
MERITIKMEKDKMMEAINKLDTETMVNLAKSTVFSVATAKTAQELHLDLFEVYVGLKISEYMVETYVRTGDIPGSTQNFLLDNFEKWKAEYAALLAQNPHPEKVKQYYPGGTESENEAKARWDS